MILFFQEVYSKSKPVKKKIPRDYAEWDKYVSYFFIRSYNLKQYKHDKSSVSNYISKATEHFLYGACHITLAGLELSEIPASQRWDYKWVQPCKQECRRLKEQTCEECFTQEYGQSIG